MAECLIVRGLCYYVTISYSLFLILDLTPVVA